MRAFHSLSSFRGHSAFYTWLFRITVNVATDRQRQRGAQARAFGAGAGARGGVGAHARPIRDGGPDQVATRAEQRERIRQALDALPPKARTIIMLSDVEGLSYREIAEVLNCPIGTVMSRLHNARKRLQGAPGTDARPARLARGSRRGRAGRAQQSSASAPGPAAADRRPAGAAQQVCAMHSEASRRPPGRARPRRLRGVRSAPAARPTPPRAHAATAPTDPTSG